MFFLFKQNAAYEMRISNWISDVCSSDLGLRPQDRSRARHGGRHPAAGAGGVVRPASPAPSRQAGGRRAGLSPRAPRPRRAPIASLRRTERPRPSRPPPLLYPPPSGKRKILGRPRLCPPPRPLLCHPQPLSLLRPPP